MPSDPRQRDQMQDAAVAGTFPASDPPAGTAESGTRAVPPERMMSAPHQAVAGAVPLRRRFPDGESAKLALEDLVRDGPLDRSCAELRPEADAVELRIAAPPEDAERLKRLLDAA